MATCWRTLKYVPVVLKAPVDLPAGAEVWRCSMKASQETIDAVVEAVQEWVVADKAWGDSPSIITLEQRSRAWRKLHNAAEALPARAPRPSRQDEIRDAWVKETQAECAKHGASAAPVSELMITGAALARLLDRFCAPKDGGAK